MTPQAFACQQDALQYISPNGKIPHRTTKQGKPRQRGNPSHDQSKILENHGKEATQPIPYQTEQQVEETTALSTTPAHVKTWQKKEPDTTPSQNRQNMSPQVFTWQLLAVQSKISSPQEKAAQRQPIAEDAKRTQGMEPQAVA